MMIEEVKRTSTNVVKPMIFESSTTLKKEEIDVSKQLEGSLEEIDMRGQELEEERRERVAETKSARQRIRTK
jgi:hypothetical protein